MEHGLFKTRHRSAPRGRLPINGSSKGAFGRYEDPRTGSHAYLRPILKLSVLYIPFRARTPASATLNYWRAFANGRR